MEAKEFLETLDGIDESISEASIVFCPDQVKLIGVVGRGQLKTSLWLISLGEQAAQCGDCLKYLSDAISNLGDCAAVKTISLSQIVAPMPVKLNWIEKDIGSIKPQRGSKASRKRNRKNRWS